MSEFGRFDEAPLDDVDNAFTGPNLTEEMRLGQACQFLVNSEAYQLALTTMQERIFAGFKATPLRDSEGLTYLRLLQQCVNDFDTLLRDGADTGKMAAEQLTRLQEEATQHNAERG